MLKPTVSINVENKITQIDFNVNVKYEKENH